MPDNVLFEGGAGETIRRTAVAQFRFPHVAAPADRHLLQAGRQGERLFFDKKRRPDEPNTKELWIYDLRTNQRFTLKERPMVAGRPRRFRRLLPIRPTPRAHGERAVPALRLRRADRTRQGQPRHLLAEGRHARRSRSLPPPDKIAAEIVENLEAALDRFRKVAKALDGGSA